MANCHGLFEDFHGRIKLSSRKKEHLRQGRDALREKIKQQFIDSDELVPDFRIQGSFAMKTIVNPLDGEYDIDDGVYLQNLSDDQSEWETPQAVHKWIRNAVENHTKADPIDKNTCVRVPYAKDYHVDLPIYAEEGSETYLAVKGEEGWIKGNPIGLVEWFRSKTDNEGQLLRLIRYIKAWSDYKQEVYGKLPCGLVLTVLASRAYTEGNDRDDVALTRISKKIFDKLSESYKIPNPVNPEEDLMEENPHRLENLQNAIDSLLEKADKAIGVKSLQEACEYWRNIFGDRFPSCSDVDEEGGPEPEKTEEPTTLGNDDARSAGNLSC